MDSMNCTAAGADLSVDFVDRPEAPWLWVCRDCGRRRTGFAGQMEAELNFSEHPHPASHDDDAPFYASTRSHD